jgi:hypothetical protein
MESGRRRQRGKQKRLKIRHPSMVSLGLDCS